MFCDFVERRYSIEYGYCRCRWTYSIISARRRKTCIHTALQRCSSGFCVASTCLFSYAIFLTWVVALFGSRMNGQSLFTSSTGLRTLAQPGLFDSVRLTCHSQVVLGYPISRMYFIQQAERRHRTLCLSLLFLIRAATPTAPKRERGCGETPDCRT